MTASQPLPNEVCLTKQRNWARAHHCVAFKTLTICTFPTRAQWWCVIAWPHHLACCILQYVPVLKIATSEPHIGTVKSCQSIGRCNHVNIDDLHFLPPRVQWGWHCMTTSPRLLSFAICISCLIISDLRAPHRHGKIMVTTRLYLSIEMF